MNNYHELAKSIKKSVKNGTVHKLEGQNALENIFKKANKKFIENLPSSPHTRNRQANKLQEIMRWSQGNWNYKSAKKN